MNPKGLDCTAAWSTSCGRTTSSRSPPSSIGTCPRRSTTGAAGSTATAPPGSPSTPRSSSVPSMATSGSGPPSTSPGWSHRWQLPLRRARAWARNLFEAPIASHNLLRAHGAAVEAYRAVGPAPHRLGGQHRAQAPGHRPAGGSGGDEPLRRLHEPAVPRPGLQGAIRRMREIFGVAWPEFPEEDFDLIRAPLDSSASTTTPAT